jgi:DNA-binding PadR family transcriptional regulator
MCCWARLPLVILQWPVYNDDVKQRPLQEPTFLILTALAAGAQHGYGIMTDVASISGGQVTLRAGTLYAALDRLAAEQLIEVDREEIVDTRLRRYYRLTRPGAERLGAEVERIRAHAAVAARRLGLLGGLA